MKAFEEFGNMDASFWAFVKYISEAFGYTERKTNRVKTYSESMISSLCISNGINMPNIFIKKASDYSIKRAEILNEFVRPMLMNAKEAQEEFNKLERIYNDNHFNCKIPMNKQKGDKKQVAFYTAMINILAELTINKFISGKTGVGFDDDPRTLTYFWDEKGQIVGASSRRFDGAYPSTINPKLVWEIKEYYYATTFGSRVADGVYETQLDGFEFKEITDRTGIKVYHVLFIDAYFTWWKQGRSYLCRIIDAINSGVVDEVIVGREVFTRWPELLKEVINMI